MAERCAASVDSLVVLTGRHCGASVSLRDGSAIIGGGEEATVLLSDPSVRDSSILIETSAKGHLLASCLSGTCRLGRSALEPDAKPRRLRHGQIITVGDVSLRLGGKTADNDSIVGRASGPGVRSWMSVAALAVVAFGVSGFIGMTGGFATTDGASQVVAVKRVTAQKPALAALADLRVMLQELSLPGVRVELDPGGMHIVANGRVSAAGEPVWQRVTEWYDAKYGADVMLESAVELETGGIVLPFDIQAVFTHPRPRIVLHDGSDHGIGAVLPGGWTVEAIDAAAVRISRDENVILVRF